MMGIFSKNKIAPPSIWGKHRSHADYVSHHVSSGQSEDWQRWLQVNLYAKMHVNVSSVKVLHSIDEWQKEAKQRESHTEIVRQLPATFILPPGSLFFSLKDYVIGAISQSADKVRRTHPLIIYQTVSEEWLTSYFEQSKKSDFQDWLFWMTRILAIYQLNENRYQSFENMRLTIDKMWSKFQPKFLFLKTQFVMPVDSECQAVLKQSLGEKNYMASIRAHNALYSRMHGVKYLPWADWPKRVLEGDKKNNLVESFWQQDTQGRYISADDSLAGLWRLE